MNSTTRILFSIVVLALGAHDGRGTGAGIDPDKDPEMTKLLREAQDLAQAKNLPGAVKKCDAVIDAFKKSYADRKEKIYCARTSAESLGYLMKAAAEMNRGTGTKSSAITLSATWSNAYYTKGYALLELGRRADAKVAIEKAVELAPWNPQYLCELGNIYQREKDWSRAQKVFELAEDQAPLSPDNSKAEELGRARRGLAYVLVELGHLDQAEKKYQQCLKADPKDTRAARELEYARQLRTKGKLN